jgi:hypothetical protein
MSRTHSRLWHISSPLTAPRRQRKHSGNRRDHHKTRKYHSTRTVSCRFKLLLSRMRDLPYAQEQEPKRKSSGFDD